MPLGLSFALFLLLYAVGMFLFALTVNARLQGILSAIALIVFAVGILRMNAATLTPDLALGAKSGEEISLEGYVFEEPDIREGSTRIPVRVDNGIGVLVVSQAHITASYGDIVRVEGTLRLPESFETGAGRAFNYPAYLAKSGISYTLSFAEVEVTGKGATNPVKSFAIWIKQKFLEGLGRSLQEPHAGLAGGITVGDKRGLGDDLSDVFRIVGLVHIIVLSGYNIMIVMDGITRILRWFSASRYILLGATIAVAVLFALMTGLASASVRAASMAVIAVVGRMTGRMYLASRALALVAVGMVLWNPFILAFDPGFQLSIAATAGLIAFTPILISRLRFVPVRLGLREIAATTIGTQIAVLPLLLYETGQLSLVALPVNLLALAVVPYAMLLSAIAGVGGLVLGPLAPLAGFPAYLLLSYILLIAEWAARIPYANITIAAFSGAILVLSYVALIAVLRIFSRPHSNSNS